MTRNGPCREIVTEPTAPCRQEHTGYEEPGHHTITDESDDRARVKEGQPPPIPPHSSSQLAPLADIWILSHLNSGSVSLGSGGSKPGFRIKRSPQ